jgi:hypothetical protein
VHWIPQAPPPVPHNIVIEPRSKSPVYSLVIKLSTQEKPVDEQT